jgi:hypothetical protein
MALNVLNVGLQETALFVEVGGKPNSSALVAKEVMNSYKVYTVRIYRDQV